MTETVGDWRTCADPECQHWQTCTKAHACLSEAVEHHAGTGLGDLLTLEEGRKRLAQYAETVAPNGDTITEMPQITRVEVIDYGHGGNVYSTWKAHRVAISVQDQGRTLKVFIHGD